MALAVIDVAEQATVRQVELLIRQQDRHFQVILFDPCCGNQGVYIRCQTLLDGALERQTECPLHGR